MDVPLDLLTNLPDCSTHICVGETLGPLLALVYEGPALSRRLPIFFVDNLALLTRLILGRIRELDLGALTAVIHLRRFLLGDAPW